MCRLASVKKLLTSAGCNKRAGWQSQKIQVVTKGLSDMIVAMHTIYTHWFILVCLADFEKSCLYSNLMHLLGISRKIQIHSCAVWQILEYDWFVQDVNKSAGCIFLKKQ